MHALSGRGNTVSSFIDRSMMCAWRRTCRQTEERHVDPKFLNGRGGRRERRAEGEEGMMQVRISKKLYHTN